MPRLPRQKSESGIYHIMLRGINQQVIFEDEEDYLKFVETLINYKAISGYKLFAYCLMSNHIHILLQVGKEELDIILKRIAGSYVYWYNWKYYRKGHLFQDRFRSEAIDDTDYFLTVLRYIHQNPIKAGIVDKIGKYKYSSYNEYERNDNGFIDKAFVFDMIGYEALIAYLNEETEDKCLDVDDLVFRLSDADAMKEIKKVSGCNDATEFQVLDRPQRDKYIKKLKKDGLSIRQISRLTGISFAIVRRL